ncbi:hypothetical protein [Streptomyces sp. NPDC047028]|uniref:hypothetical protein n=1 Tax=Streptomyces sp. NPDC047028 TaxID=3155793 RepID=UPI0033EF2CA2
MSDPTAIVGVQVTQQVKALNRKQKRLLKKATLTQVQAATQLITSATETAPTTTTTGTPKRNPKEMKFSGIGDDNAMTIQASFNYHVDIMKEGARKILYFAEDSDDYSEKSLKEVSEGDDGIIVRIRLGKEKSGECWYEETTQGKLKNYIPLKYRFDGVATGRQQPTQQITPFSTARDRAATFLIASAPAGSSLWACVDVLPSSGLYVIYRDLTWYHATSKKWDALEKQPTGVDKNTNMYALSRGQKDCFRLNQDPKKLEEVVNLWLESEFVLKEKKSKEKKSKFEDGMRTMTDMTENIWTDKSDGNKLKYRNVLLQSSPITFLGQEVSVSGTGDVTAGGDPLYTGGKGHDIQCKITDLSDIRPQADLFVDDQSPLHKRDGHAFRFGMRIEDYRYYAQFMIDRIKGTQGIELEPAKLIINLAFPSMRAHYSLFNTPESTVQGAIENALENGQDPGTVVAQRLLTANGAHATLEPTGFSTTNINVYADGRVIYQGGATPVQYQLAGSPTFAVLTGGTITAAKLNQWMRP